MASWSDAKINMMDEKADKEVDEMLFQFAFLLYDTSEHHLAAHCLVGRPTR